MNIENIINGENFKRICNVIISPDTINEHRVYDSKNIIFCKTDYLQTLFNEISELDGNNILISHQSDYEINKYIFDRKPKSISRWYAQNVNHRDDNLIPIPIGIENHTGSDKGTLIDLDFLSNLNPTYNNINKITDKLYCNFNVNTHHNRSNVKEFLIRNELCHVDDFGIKSKDFHTNLSKYLFVASPRGNGIDCHRTWESLIMGSIPIVERHHMFDNYKLPILQIDSWDELVNTNILEIYKDKYLKGDLFNNMEQLKMDYWINLILDDFKKI